MKISLESTIELLKQSKVVAIPTETVYGLAGMIDSKDALELIFKTKERPFFDPLIIHVSSIEMTEGLIESNQLIEKLMNKFWPGPLTIVAKKTEQVNPLITAGLNSVGLRMPNHKTTLGLIEKLGVALAAPSANKFKKTSPTQAQHVLDDFDSKVPVLDGGACEIGIESTVLEVINEFHIKIYRQGMITKTQLQEFLGQEVKIEITQSKVSPGTMKDHYQPKVPFYIFDNEKPQSLDALELNLSQDARIAARELYDKLRNLSSHAKALFLIKSKHPNTNDWASIWDRLNKASTKDSSHFS